MRTSLFGDFVLGIVAAVALGGCSTLAPKLDPHRIYATETGFQFRFPMSGDWREFKGGRGLYWVGRNAPSGDRSSTALVRHGPVEGAGSATNREILASFQKDLELDANEGMICLHPRRPRVFVWMAMSERWPIGQSLSPSFEEDKRAFLETLAFVD